MTVGDVVEKLYEDNIGLIIDYYLTGKFEADRIHAVSTSDYADEASKKAIILAMALFNDFREYANEIFGQNVIVVPKKRRSRVLFEYQPDELQFCIVGYGLPDIIIIFYFRNISELLHANVVAHVFNLYWQLDQDYLDDIAFLGEVKWRLSDILEYKDLLIGRSSFIYEYGRTRWERFTGHIYI